VCEKTQGARGGDGRVLLPKRAGRGIARIGEDLAAGRFLPLIERREVRLRHINLAAHFEHVGRIADHLGNVGNRPRVGGDVLADGAVSPRRGKHQLPGFVAQRARQAVDLRFRGDRDQLVRGERQESPNPRDEFDDLLVGKRIVDAEHRLGMGNLREARSGGRRAQPLRRRIRPHELRKAHLQLAVLADECVVLGIGDLGRVTVVVQPVVTRDFLRQPHQAIGNIRFSQGVSHRRRTIPRVG